MVWKGYRGEVNSSLSLLFVGLIGACLVLFNWNAWRVGKEASQKAEVRRSMMGGSPYDKGADARTARAARLGDRSFWERRVTTTDSGLQYEVLEKGEGDSPGPRDQVEVHYEGRLEDGTVFDSSYERNSPAIFPLNAVIKGWTEGLQFMKPGARYRFTIPSHLAYGDKGAGALIEAGATLIFEVELIAVK